MKSIFIAASLFILLESKNLGKKAKKKIEIDSTYDIEEINQKAMLNDDYDI